jgi:hypothetical protein
MFDFALQLVVSDVHITAQTGIKQVLQSAIQCGKAILKIH